MKVLFAKQLTLFVSITFLIVVGLQLPAFATVRNVQTSCGATGNGSTDDTSAINTCIGQLVSGDTLEFPAGTYRVSSLNAINVSNVIIDGSNNTATIISETTQQGPVLLIGQNGIGTGGGVSCGGNRAIHAGSALSATANEGSNTFSTSSPLSGVAAGGYALLLQGGSDSSEGSGNTGCDPSGCRAELVNITSVAGNTYTVANALNDTWNPSVNGAIACSVTGMISNVTLRNITVDGGTTTAQSAGNTWAVEFNDCVNCTVTGVTFRNALGSAFIHSVNYGDTFSNIKISGAGSEGCGAALQGYANSNMTFGTASLSSLNPGTNRGSCLVDGAFGFEEVGLVNSALTNVTVNSAGTGGGRPMKLTASRHNTFDSLTVENGCCAFNGLSLEYYSSHNTFNNCSITNNAAGSGSGGAGINTFGNYNQYNSFNNCTVTGNGNAQILISNYDALRLGQDIGITINGTTVGGPGIGMLVNTSNGCINNNTLLAGSGLSTGISVMNSTNLGSGNVLNGFSSNLTTGTCGTSGAPMPPTGLTAVVQ